MAVGGAERRGLISAVDTKLLLRVMDINKADRLIYRDDLSRLFNDYALSHQTAYISTMPMPSLNLLALSLF